MNRSNSKSNTLAGYYRLTTKNLLRAHIYELRDTFHLMEQNNHIEIFMNEMSEIFDHAEKIQKSENNNF